MPLADGPRHPHLAAIPGQRPGAAVADHQAIVQQQAVAVQLMRMQAAGAQCLLHIVVKPAGYHKDGIPVAAQNINVAQHRITEHLRQARGQHIYMLPAQLQQLQPPLQSLAKVHASVHGQPGYAFHLGQSARPLRVLRQSHLGQQVKGFHRYEGAVKIKQQYGGAGVDGGTGGLPGAAIIAGLDSRGRSADNRGQQSDQQGRTMHAKLTTRILMAMAIGIVIGSIYNLLRGWLAAADPGGWIAQTIGWIDAWMVHGLLDIVGQVFIRSLKLLVVPLVLVSLILGTWNLGGSARMGIMAGKTVGLYLFTTAVAITMAMIMATLIHPGSAELAVATSVETKDAPPLKSVLINMFPTNPVAAMADGNMLQIIVFAILSGLALSRAGAAGDNLRKVLESINEVIMQMVMILMRLAPWGVAALVIKLFSTLGFGAIAELGTYFLTVAGVLVMHGILVYGTLVSLAGLSPLMFFHNIRPAMVFAFSTASSNATVPITLNAVTRRCGADSSVASFTVPLGATINMDGTAVMQGIATVFIAQTYGIDIGIAGYLTVIVTATLASIGTAGVPGVGLIMLAMVLQQVGLPTEGIALIIGIDRLLDMMRTAVNVSGDSMVTTLVSHSEGKLDKKLFHEKVEFAN